MRQNNLLPNEPADIPSWFFIFIFIMFACFYAFVSNEDYNWERAQECAAQGKYHNRSTDKCQATNLKQS